MGKYISTIQGSPIIQIVYYPDENRFYDTCGKLICNVFEMITPNDLLIHRNDPGITMFRHRNIPRTHIEILEDDAYLVRDYITERSGLYAS